MFGLFGITIGVIVGLDMLIVAGPVIIPLTIVGALVGSQIGRGLKGALFGALMGGAVFGAHRIARRLRVPRMATFALDALVVALFIGAAFLPGIGYFAAGIDGSLTLSRDTSIATINDSQCTSTGRNSDINHGFLIKLEDSTGRLLATAPLGSGSFDNQGRCVFRFMIKPIPDAIQYVFDLGVHGTLPMTRAELGAARYKVELGLGSAAE